MKITLEDVMDWNPCCYEYERVSELIGDGLTPREISELDIPAIDRFWVLGMIVCEGVELVWSYFKHGGSKWDVYIANALIYIEEGLEL